MIRLLIWIAYAVYAYVTYRIFETDHGLAIAAAAVGLAAVFIEGRIHFARARRRS